MSHAELAARLATQLSQHCAGTVLVRSIEPLIGGACQDNFRVELDVSDETNGTLPKGAGRYVLRSDALQSLPGSLRRKDEFAVLQAAVSAGVRTPPARVLLPSLVRAESDAYLMDWFPGEAIGRKIVRNPELSAARKQLPSVLAGELAKIHSVRPEAYPSLALQNFGRVLEHGAVEAGLEFLRRMMDHFEEPHPALEAIYRWLRENQPAKSPLVLVHGDFRTGNFLVTEAGLSAVLDWEFAHWGDPMEDLGWICVRDWRFGKLDLPVGGFAKREALFSAYTAATKQPVDTKAVHYWEIMGNARWAAGSIFQGERYLSGQEADLELIAIAKRANEMEYEALRLIERGPR